MSLKILNILEDARGGGIVNRVLEVAQYLENENIETIVLCPKQNSEKFIAKLAENKIQFHQRRIYRLTTSKFELLKYILNFIFEVFAICNIIRKEKIDIVHCNSSWQIKGIIATCFTKARSVWHLNDTKQHPVIRGLFRFFYPLSDAFIFASMRTKKYYLSSKGVIGKPIKIIQAPINFEKYKNCTELFNEIESFEGTKIVTVGHINPNKGIDTLIETANEIKNNSCTNVNFFVVGKVFKSQKKYFQRIERLIDDYNIDNVHFLGYQRDIPSILNSVDIYLCTSNNEASPISVWEGMAAGKPVISTDVGDVKKIFETYKCGKVCKVGDYKGLAKQIEYLIRNDEVAYKLSRSAYRIAKEFFDVKIISKQHEDIYKKVCS